MRENIGLFRGKRIDTGDWVEGNLFIIKRYSTDIDHYFILPTDTIYGYDDLLLMAWEVDPATVGECTGLTDKNGKLIFEGDILRIAERGIVADGGIVVFENGYPGGWLIKSPTSENKCSLSMRTDIEIIGNIHDNPKLLKEGADNG